MLRRGVWEYFRLRPRSAADIAEEVDEEIALHLELRAQELIALGCAREAARAEAERRFGELERSRSGLYRIAEERERSMNMGEWLSGWSQDFRYAGRALRRQPLLAVVIVLTLGLGIGANVVMFGIVDELLLRGPAHVVEPDQVRRVYATTGTGENEKTGSHTAYIVYSRLKERTSIVQGAAAYRTGEARVGRGEQAVEVPVGWSTYDLFPLLGVEPALGRFYTEDEARPKQPHYVAVLDYGYWQSEFGGRTDVLGQTIHLDRRDYEIIGVAPQGFTGAERKTVLAWLPLSTSYEPHPEWPTSWNATWLHVIARLQPGVDPDRADAEATAAYRSTGTEAQTRVLTARVSLRPLGYTSGGVEPAEYAVSRWLIGVSIIVLLVACANVVNLLLARGMRRRRELAVRVAMGISRGRLVRLLVSESLLLAVLGGTVAALLAYWGGRFMRATLLPDVQWASPLSTRVVMLTAAVVLVTGVLTGIAPAVQAARRNLTSSLKFGTGGSGTRRSYVRDGLTVLQAALSLVLLIGAGLFVRSLWNVRDLDLGIDADQVLAVRTAFPSMEGMTPEQRTAELERRAASHQTVAERLRSHPEIANAALALGVPFQGGFIVELRVPGYDSIPQLVGGGPFTLAVSPGYFETVGTRIVRGRGVEPGEGRGTEPVVVVNQTMAQTLWPDADPLTKCIYIGSGDDVPCARVVGIAEDTKRSGLRDEPSMQYYIPFGQERGIGGTQIVVRPKRDAADFLPALRPLLHQLEPRADYFHVDLLQTTLEPEIRPWRMGATMFLVFGGLALLIAAIGLYSVVAYAVGQRRTEIGVRMALGARAGGIIGMVLREGVGLVLLGIALGVPLALAGGRMLETLLFDTSARDAATFAVVALVLTLVAIGASVIPAARAARTSPVEALRAD